MLIRRHALVFVALVSLGCSDATGLPEAINGTWQHSDPAFASTITLSQDRGVIAGTGEWFGEACCTGTVIVTGTVSGRAVSLDLIFTPTTGGPVLPAPSSQHFEGTLSGHDLLTGTVSSGGVSAPYTYHRT